MTTTRTEVQKNQFIDFFQSGTTKRENRKIGLELEHIIVNSETKETVSYYGENGIESILQSLRPLYDTVTECNGHLIGLERKGNIISLEPAGQFEIALCPVTSLGAEERLYSKARHEADEIVAKLGYEIQNIGYHPRSNPRDMPLIPKKRYQYMDEYFKTTGTHGIDMMRGSAATQVSLDYTDEADFMVMFRLANILSPILALATDNSPYFMGSPYQKYMARTKIWNDVDKDRSMVVANSLNHPFGFSDYADYILNAPAILVLDAEGNPVYTGNTPIAEYYANQDMNTSELEHLLSMFFPDVRLKTYMEIRMADSMPLPYVLSYIGILKGIFYNDTNKKELSEKFRNITNDDVTAAKIELMAKGYDGTIYGEKPKNLLLELLRRSEIGLSEEERPYLAPLKDLVLEETTLAKKYHENHI